MRQESKCSKTQREGQDYNCMYSLVQILQGG
jgi:hypothetical protein